MSGVIHGSGVRPALCHAVSHCSPSTRSSSPATACAVARNSVGYGSPLATTRAGSEWAVKTTRVAAGIAANRSPRSRARKSTNAGSTAHDWMPVAPSPYWPAASSSLDRYCPTESPE